MSDNNEVKENFHTLAVAELAHEINKAYCHAIGDYTQRSWSESSEDVRSSAVAGVYNVINNPDLTPEEIHELWCHFKKLDGWTHGDFKCAVNKTHPCLTEYSNLPQEQKVKDYLFLASVKKASELIEKVRKVVANAE